MKNRKSKKRKPREHKRSSSNTPIRKAVYSICSNCNGLGYYYSPFFFADSSTAKDNISSVRECKQCSSTGKIDTGMFVEL